MGEDKASEPLRRLAYGLLRLDSATLRPLDSPSGWTLYEALPWWSAKMPHSEFFAGARAQVSPSAPPPPPSPAADRRADASPPWDLEPLRAAARVAAGAPPDVDVRVLAWDVYRDKLVACGEHAVVALQFVDAGGRTRWMVALMRRYPPGELAPGSPISAPDQEPTPGRPADPPAWRVRDSGPAGHEFYSGWPRRLLLTRPPTDRDIQDLLAGTDSWSFNGDRSGPCAIVDGDVDDGAWRAVTGEPPSRRYPPEIERPG